MSDPPGAEATYNADFAAYYDLITSHKDYVAEVEALAALIDRTTTAARPRVLDIGCGTGAHAALLSERDYEVTAIDPSPEMARRARAKAARAAVRCADLATLDGRDFDFAYSVYNVVNCLDSLEALLDFARQAAARLVEGGSLLLEAWNPVAVIAAPPEKVVRTYESDAGRVSRTALPRPDFLSQRLDLDYEIVVQDGSGRADAFTVTHELLLFTPLEIEFALRTAGFGDVRTLTALPQLSEASAHDRMLAFSSRYGA